MQRKALHTRTADARWACAIQTWEYPRPVYLTTRARGAPPPSLGLRLFLLLLHAGPGPKVWSLSQSHVSILAQDILRSTSYGRGKTAKMEHTSNREKVIDRKWISCRLREEFISGLRLSLCVFLISPLAHLCVTYSSTVYLADTCDTDRYHNAPPPYYDVTGIPDLSIPDRQTDICKFGNDSIRYRNGRTGEVAASDFVAHKLR